MRHKISPEPHLVPIPASLCILWNNTPLVHPTMEVYLVVIPLFWKTGASHVKPWWVSSNQVATLRTKKVLRALCSPSISHFSPPSPVSTFFEKIPREHLRAGGGGDYLRWISKRSAILQVLLNDIEYYSQCDESVLACVQVVYPLHRRNCPINATNSPTRQGVCEGGTCVICTALFICMYRHRNSMQRRLAWVQSVSQWMWCRKQKLWLVRLISEREMNQDPDGSEPWTGRSFRHDPGVGRSHLRLIMFPWFETRSWMNRPVMQPLIIDMYGVK